MAFSIHILLSLGLLASSAASAGLLEPASDATPVLSESIDPDEPAFRYEIIGRRWQAQSGVHLPLKQWSTEKRHVELYSHGFLELANFTHGLPVPWQAYRANLGFSTRWTAIDPPSSGLTTALDIGVFHESDHAADSWSYIDIFGEDYLDLYSFNNGGISSYEYLKVRVWLQGDTGRWRYHIAPSGRYFTPPLSPESRRHLNASIACEARIARRLMSGRALYLGGYSEWISHDFVASEIGVKDRYSPENLRYLNAEAGVTLPTLNAGQFALRLLASHSNGRGIDFILDYGPTFGVGLRYMP